MPITINDCVQHKIAPIIEAYGGLVIYCTECEKLDDRDTLYVGGTNAMSAVKEWNEANAPDDSVHDVER